MSSTGLKDGRNPSTVIARAITFSYKKWGQTERPMKNALAVLNRYFKKDSSVKGCPIGAHWRSHPFTSCPAALARGFTITYDPAKDTLARKAHIHEAVDRAVEARLAVLDRQVDERVQARLSQVQAPAPAPDLTIPDASALATGNRVAVGDQTLPTIPQGDLDNFTDWSTKGGTWYGIMLSKIIRYVLHLQLLSLVVLLAVPLIILLVLVSAHLQKPAPP